MKVTRPIETTLWPLRKLGWKVEDKVLWPLSDALRSKRSADGFRERRAWTRLFSRPAAGDGSVPERAQTSERDRALRNRGDVRLALATVGAAAAVGVGIAALTGPPGSTQNDDPRAAALPSAPPAALPSLSRAPTQAEGKRTSTLEGVTPNFKQARKADQAAPKAAAASAAPAAAVNPLQNTNAKPSAIPAAAANGPKPLRVVRDFAGAFVLYEVGTTGPRIKGTFTRTATPSLAKALRDRPPRLPGSASVPRARVQNVILGERRGRTLDASVSLLRLGDLSELRLTLTLRRKAWAVSEVRG